MTTIGFDCTLCNEGLYEGGMRGCAKVGQGTSALGQRAALQWDRALLQWDRGWFCTGTSGMGAALQWDARVYEGLRTGTFSLGTFSSVMDGHTQKESTREISNTFSATT